MYPSSDPIKPQKTSESFSKYVFKYSLSQNANDKYDAKLTQDQTCSGIASLTSESSSKDVFRRIAEIAKRHDTPDFQLPNRKLYNAAVKRNKRKENFISFSQLQHQDKVENDEHLFNNSFEFDETVVNDYKMDSEWNCDTQLASLVDNADALMNIASSKEMTQLWPNKIDHSPTDHSLVDNATLNNNDYLDTVSLCSTANGFPNSRGISITQPTYSDADSVIFKVPPSKNSIVNISLQTISKSQPIESTSSLVEPLLFSQDGGFKNVEVISVKSLSKENDLVGEYTKLNENKLTDVNKNGLLIDFSEEIINGSLISCDSKLVNAKKDNTVDKDSDEDICNLKLTKSNDASHIVLLNKTYNVSNEPNGVLTTKVVNAEDWEQFFNNTMNSSYPSNASKDESHNSDEDIPSSPILVSQKTTETRGKLSSTKLNCLKIGKIQSDFHKNLIENEKGNQQKTSSDNHKLVQRTTLNEDDAHSSKLNIQKTNFISDQNQHEKDSAFEDNNFDDGNIFEVTTESGFITANSKPITISQELIEKAKSLFDDIEIESEMGKIDFDMFDEKIHNGNINEASVRNKGDDHKNIENDINLVVRDPMHEMIPKNLSEISLKVETKLINNQVIKMNDALKVEQMNINDTEFEKDLPTGEGAESRPNKFCGFTTASNKQISISKEALKKAQDVINKVDDETDEGIWDKPNQFYGFTTAGNKQISVSDEALKKAKAVIDAIDVDEHLESESRQNQFHGFSTASNKCIKVSDKSLKMAQAIIDRVDHETKSNKFCGFTTASNKQISVSDEALKKAKAVIDATDVEEILESKPNQFQGFTTVSNKKIKVSNVALKKAQAVINKIDEETEIVNESKPNQFCGFTTASNKQISISDEALKKAKAVIDATDVNEHLESESRQNQFHGFSTASNKYIKVSDESLKKAQAIIDKIDNSNKFCGFMTASNKQITVSDVALKNAQAVINKIDEETDIVNERESNQFCGFTTASNKQISISDEALKKAKAVIDATDVEDIFGSESRPNQFQGFTTASYKQIGVSEEALKKAKAVIDATDVDEELERETKPNQFCGFTTASNKQISVSGEALKKAKAVIDASDVEEELGSKPNQFQGFTTASNKKIRVSDIALKNAQAVINKIDEETDIVNERESNQFCGFTTASNKQISISDEALKKAKAVIDATDVEDIFGSESRPNQFQGFTTASNKQIGVSEEALKKAKAVIDATDVDEELERETKPNQFCGFTTASNKQISVSDEALKKAKAVIDASDVEEELGSKPNQFLGFTSDSNIQIRVSGEALKKSKAVIHASDVQENLGTESRPNEFCGFTTASNKQIAVSDVALKKAKAVIDATDVDEDLGSESKQNQFCGFTTTSKKQITVSDVALKKAKSVIDATDEYLGTGPDLFCEPIITVNKKSFASGDASINPQKVVALKDTLKQFSENTILSGNLPSTSTKSHMNKATFLNDSTSIGLTQEIEDSTKAFLRDEDKYDLKEDLNVAAEAIEYPSSPILPTRSKKAKRVFQAPYKDGSKESIEQAERFLKKRKVEDPIVILNNSVDSPANELVSLVNLLDKKSHSSNRYSLKNFKPNCQGATDEEIDGITPENAEQFVFKNDRIDVPLKNIMTEVTVHNIAEIFSSYLCVNKKLIPDKWMFNHLKWIIWKLASYERFFKEQFSGILTVGNVLKQLKYRYDKELFKAERPILRKILECDDASERKMILCVSRIIKSTQENEEPLNIPRFELEATDGWYGVMATVDSLITAAISKGRLKVGTKIITCGADLLNVGQGKSPLEDISDVRLRLHGNSTRIAPWHSKLGLCHQGLLRISCDSLKARAGPVPVLHFLPIVVYPRSFIEKLPTGDTVTRSEKLEQVYLSSMEGETQSRIEQLYIDAEKELMEANKKQKESSAKRLSLLLNPKSRQQLNEDELLEIVEQASDPEDLMTLLSATQRESLMKSLSKKQAIKREKIDSRVKEMMKERNVGTVNRKVVSILKVRGLILEVNKGTRKVVPVMLTVWKVQDAMLELLNKMCLLNIYWAIPTGSKMGELHLSTGKQTFFAEVKNQNYIDNFPGMQRYIRKTSSIFEMNLPKFSPIFSEVDTVGLVFKIEPSTMSQTNHNSSTNSLQMSPNMQTVYMADENINIVAVHFWGGVVKFGYEKTIEEGKLLTCCNLQHRPRSSVKRFRNLYATEYSTFCQCPRKKHLVELNQILENKFKNVNRIEFLETCRKRLIELANKHKLNSVSGVNNSSSTSNGSLSSNFSYSRSKRKLELDENSLSGLDFDSSFNEPSSVRNSPNVTSSRQIVSTFDGDTSDIERRIKKLRRLYDEPPPLSPVILNVSKSLKKDFITPPAEVSKTNPTIDKDGDSLLCDDKHDSDPFKENFIYSPPDVE